MFIVIETKSREHKCRVFSNKDNADRYVANQISKRIREDIEKISFQNGMITYLDGTEIWYDIVQVDMEDE